MSDPIDRQAAIDTLRDYLVGKRCPDDGTLTCRLIENEVINKLPSIQPDIILCPDCRYNDGTAYCELHFRDVKAKDYCSWAERREDG